MSLKYAKIHAVLSSIGIIAGFSAYCVFFYYFKYIEGSLWAFGSAVVAAINFQLHILHIKNKLEEWHNGATLASIQCLGFIILSVSAGIMYWYCFQIFYVKSPHYLEEATIISAVWAFMTAKWGLMLFMASKKYAKMLEQSYPPLLTS